MCHANTLCLLALALGAVWLIAVALDPARSGATAASSPSLPTARDRAMQDLRLPAAVGSSAGLSMPGEAAAAAVTEPVDRSFQRERP